MEDREFKDLTTGESEEIMGCLREFLDDLGDLVDRLQYATVENLMDVYCDFDAFHAKTVSIVEDLEDRFGIV